MSELNISSFCSPHTGPTVASQTLLASFLVSLPLCCPFNVGAPGSLFASVPLGRVLHCMASVVSLLGRLGVQGMLPEEETFESGLQKERICRAVRSRWD